MRQGTRGCGVEPKTGFRNECSRCRRVFFVVFVTPLCLDVDWREDPLFLVLPRVPRVPRVENPCVRQPPIYISHGCMWKGMHE